MEAEYSSAALARIYMTECERLGDEFDISISNKKMQITYLLSGVGYLYVFFAKDDTGKEAEVFAYACYDTPNEMAPVFTISENGKTREIENAYFDMPVQMKKIIEGYADPEVRVLMGRQTYHQTYLEGEIPVCDHVPERKEPKKLYKLNQSLMDTYFISVKNRLKDYFVAANSIPYLPFQQKVSANTLAERIDSFINTRLFDTVRLFLRMDAEQYNPGFRMTDRSTDGHTMLVAKYFPMMDYFFFRNVEKQTNTSFYTDVTYMDSIPPAQVMSALQDASEKLLMLSKCQRLEDIPSVCYFKNVYEALLASTFCTVNLEKYDTGKGLMEISIVPEDETQTKAILRYLESNWERKVDEIRDTQCRIDHFSGVPRLNIILSYSQQGIYGESGFVPVYMAIRPTPELESYGGGVNINEVPEEFFEMMNSAEVIEWVNDQIDRSR